ncbi:transglycosylase domain-containing protein [Actinocorallia lasiicapitis]
MLKLVAASVVAGVLVALVALPFVGSTGIAARDEVDEFMGLGVAEINQKPPERTVVYDAKGNVIVSFYDQFRESVKLSQVAPIMQKAMVAIEDARFFDHGALDLKGTLRAAVKNVTSKNTEGGSTLTQQLAKNQLVNDTNTKEGYDAVTAPTLDRKLRELRLAMYLEQTMSKEQILEGYLNIANFGASSYGVQAAAKRYFSKSASQLTLAEAATLAGITKNPVQLDPIENPKDSKTRRDTVLQRMADVGIIGQDEADAAKKTRIKLKEYKPKGGCETSKSPYFCEYVRGEMVKIFIGDKKPADEKEKQSLRAAAIKKLNSGGYKIYTTLDPKTQKAAENGLKYGGYVTAKSNRVATQAMVEPGTGKIKAIAVSKKYGTDPGETTYNLAADQEHGGSGQGVQPGSTFKVFTLLAALDNGIPIRTSLGLGGGPRFDGYTNCAGQDAGSKYDPGNAGGGKGPWNLKTGTANSVNTFYADLEAKVGLCEAVKMAEKFGLKRADGKPLEQVPSQVLGSQPVDMVHMATAYAGIAARGKFCDPVAVTRVVGQDGKELKLPEKKCEQVIDQQVADAAADIMTNTFRNGTASSVGTPDGRPAAGKTGTCDQSVCTAFAGFTPQLAAAVAYWDIRGMYGYPVNVYGATVCGPMWRDSMAAALKGLPFASFKKPTRDFGDVRIKSIPNVAGQDVGKAVAMLKAAGFTVKIDPRPIKSDQPLGKVARISPAGQADEGTLITIYISAGGGKPDKHGNGNGNDGHQPGNGWWPF